MTTIEAGATIKIKLYSELHRAGYFLPQFSSKAITIEALMRVDRSKFIFLKVSDVQEQIKKSTMLNAPTEFAFLCLQEFLYGRNGLVLPYDKCPDSEFLRIVLGHFDEANTLELLKTEWKNNYEQFVVLKGERKMIYTPPQGQVKQKIVDSFINKALKIRNELIWNEIRKKESMKDYEGFKVQVQKLPKEHLSEYDKFALERNPLEVEDAIFKHITGEDYKEEIVGNEAMHMESVSQIAEEEQQAQESMESASNQSFVETSFLDERIDSFELEQEGAEQPAFRGTERAGTENILGESPTSPIVPKKDFQELFEIPEDRVPKIQAFDPIGSSSSMKKGSPAQPKPQTTTNKPEIQPFGIRGVTQKELQGKTVYTLK